MLCQTHVSPGLQIRVPIIMPNQVFLLVSAAESCWTTVVTFCCKCPFCKFYLFPCPPFLLSPPSLNPLLSLGACSRFLKLTGLDV